MTGGWIAGSLAPILSGGSSIVLFFSPVPAHCPLPRLLSFLPRSFFQSLCVLGYCILPLTVALLVCRLVLIANSGTAGFIVRLLVVITMFGWSTLGKLGMESHQNYLYMGTRTIGSFLSSSSYHHPSACVDQNFVGCITSFV